MKDFGLWGREATWQPNVFTSTAQPPIPFACFKMFVSSLEQEVGKINWPDFTLLLVSYMDEACSSKRNEVVLDLTDITFKRSKK